MGKIRLDRFLSNAGCGTRTEVKQMIRMGRIRVNSERVLQSDRKVDETEDEVFLDQTPVRIEKNVWYMMNKPAGVISAVSDRAMRTVIDLMGREGKNLFPVGRLDIDTTGLLLLTDDGPLAHYLLSPHRHVEKCYEAQISGAVTDEMILQFRTGLDIGDEKKTLPAKLERMEPSETDSPDTSRVRVTITEGRFHQVKRMFEAAGSKVLTLRRISMGSISLDENLPEGSFRRLSREEILALKESADRGSRKSEEKQSDVPQMLHGIKAVLFDMDGTLMDSMWMWKDIDIEYLGRYGIELPDDLQQQIEGKGFTETAEYFRETFSLPCSVEEIKAEWNKMAFEAYRTRVPLKPGAGEFLAYLKEHGIRMAIATSNSMELALTALKANHVLEYFDCVRTACEVAAGKPSPDIYLSAAASLAVRPEECLVFEDVPMGILAGHNAGMKVCAVEDAYSKSRGEEIQSQADYYIRDYREILNGI